MRKTFIVLLALAFVVACSEEELYTENPFENNAEEELHQMVLDSNSIEGLQQNIFSLKCANPTCHDGSFEPDFRTTESTFNSLIYHPVTKNTPDEDFEFRVIPGDADSSWLYHRLQADDTLGRMPLYAEPLSNREMEQIRNWILSGAPNSQGDLPQIPNLSPVVYGYSLTDSTNTRVDRIREDGWASAMLLAKNRNFNWSFYIEDDRSSGANLGLHRLEFSYDRDNWQSFQSLTFIRLWNTVFVQSLPTSSLPQDTLMYFRYYVQDEDGALTEQPNDRSPYWLKNHYSLRVE